MSSEWLTCLIVYQLFCISVVCADKHYTVHFFYSLYGLSYTGVYRLNSLDGCIFNTCMSHHIRICKVNDHYIILS